MCSFPIFWYNSYNIDQLKIKDIIQHCNNRDMVICWHDEQHKETIDKNITAVWDGQGPLLDVCIAAGCSPENI